MLSQLLLTAMWTFLPANGASVPDRVILENGRAIDGRVVADWPTLVRVRGRGGDSKIPRAEVQSVRSLETSLDTALDRWDAMPHADPLALADLARFCASRGLRGEANDVWLCLLALDPTSELAAREIGAQKIDGQWQIQTKQRWIKLADYLGAKDRWSRAVDLRTGHFIVRTDLPLAKVLGATLALERHYRRFYDTLDGELPLYTFGDVPVVNIYSRPRDYPSPPIVGEPSWFEPSNNQLHVLVADDLDMHRIERDVTEMLFFNALRRSSVRNGEMMPWAERGFSEYFAAAHGDEPDARWQPLGAPSVPAFTQQLADKKPLTLTQLLNTSLSEFRNGPDGERRSARAYTFVHFLIDGESGAHREAFYHYLRTAWLGRGGRMLLYKELGLQPADLEKRWHQYVAAVVRSHSLSTNPFGVGARRAPSGTRLAPSGTRLAPSGSTDRALVVNARNGGVVLDGAPVLSLTTAMLASSPSSGTSPSELVISPPTIGVNVPPGAMSSASTGTAFAEAAALALSRGNH
jgi:hypothetical protein